MMSDTESDLMAELYDEAKEVACPYKNCGAGPGMECLVHHKDGAPTLRDSPHVVRVREANGDR